MEWEERFASIVKETEENIAKVRWQLERKPSEIGSSVDWLPSRHQGYTREGSPVDFVYANIAETAVDWKDLTESQNTSITAQPRQHVGRPHIQRRFSDSYNVRHPSDMTHKRPWSHTPASSTPKSRSWKHRLHSSIPSSSLIENDTFSFLPANTTAPATRKTSNSPIPSPVIMSARHTFDPSPRVPVPPTAGKTVITSCPMVPVNTAVQTAFSNYPIAPVHAPNFSPCHPVPIPGAFPDAIPDPYFASHNNGNTRNWTTDDKLDRQNKMIKHLSDMVQRLQTEREQTRCAHQQLKDDVDHMLNQVNRGHSLSTERRIEQWRREMITEMEVLRSQIHMNRTAVHADDGNTLADNHFTKLTQEILQLRRQMTDEMDQVRKEFEILKTRIVKAEADVSAMKMSKRDLEKRQHKIDQVLCELSDGALSKNNDNCQTIHDRSAEKRQMAELRYSVFSMKNKLASMEEYLDLHTPRTVRATVDKTGKEMKSSNISSGHVKKPRSRHTYEQRRYHAPPPEWLPDDWSCIDLADYSSSDFDVSLPARASQPVINHSGEFHLEGLDLTDDEIRRPMSPLSDDLDTDSDEFFDDMR